MSKILFKIHKSYRWVVAVCDEDVFGKKLVDGDRVLDLSGSFFDGDLLGEGEVRDEIVRCRAEDATFNFVGENSVWIARELGLVREEGVSFIDGVSFALVLL